MKLGFLQGGMPDWTAAEVVERARTLGFDGVGLSRKNLPNGLKTTEEELDAVRRLFDDAGVEIQHLGVHNRTTHPGINSDQFDWDEIQAELVPIARMAARLGCPGISVMIQRPSPGVTWDWKDYLNNLGRTALAAVSQAPGVRANFQNHVTSASATQLLEMVESIGDERLGVNFSPDHCIVMQEDPVELAEAHTAAIQLVSMADRRVVEEDLGSFDGRYYYVRYECCEVGDGVVPVRKLMDTLERRGFNGYASLKWEKSDAGTGPHLPNGYGWHLRTGEDVLPTFADYMRSLGVGRRAGLVADRA